MFTILLVSLIAACAAAPRAHLDLHGDHGSYPHGHPPFYPQPQMDERFAPRPHYDPFADDIFDTRQFWSEMANEFRQLDDMLTQFYEKFPAISSTQGREGNQYKITIPLNGFEEQDIVVKARAGLLMVQAVHKLEGDASGERSYLDIKTLPSCVNVTGSWTYEDNVLKIMFDADTDDVTELVTEPVVTEAHSREEMAPTGEVTGDADVGVRGDSELNRALFTNEIPRNSVEATTYAVDLKDEVEFVPVHYR